MGRFVGRFSAVQMVVVPIVVRNGGGFGGVTSAGLVAVDKYRRRFKRWKSATTQSKLNFGFVLLNFFCS